MIAMRLLLVLWTSILLFAQGHEQTAADLFKAPNSQTPPETAATWQAADQRLWQFVNETIPAVLNHTGTAAFDQHLKGVQAVLRYWNSPQHLATAGLFHSIYGTEGFQGFSLPLSERSAIVDLIGKQSERLCWIFCMVDRYTVDQTVFGYDSNQTQQPPPTFGPVVFYSRPELGRFAIVLQDKEEWLDFLELTLADWLEQVEGAASKPSELFLWKTGEAFSYRRTAYARMRDILQNERPRLSTVVSQMYHAVYQSEQDHTKDLVQERTPPMSPAAHEAWKALRSAGEIAIPDSFAPQQQRSSQECPDETTVATDN